MCVGVHSLLHYGSQWMSCTLKGYLYNTQFFPLNFPVAQELCIETPNGSSLTLTLCIFPQSGIVQTQTAEQQAAAEHSPLPQGTAAPSSNPCQAQEIWKATSCIAILIQGRWTLPGSWWWQVARIGRLLIYLVIYLLDYFECDFERSLLHRYCTTIIFTAMLWSFS